MGTAMTGLCVAQLWSNCNRLCLEFLTCCRFELPLVAPVTFNPSIGHIPPGATKDIVVTYMSDKPLQLKAAQANIKATQIKVAPGAAQSDWDNRADPGMPAAIPEPKLELASAKEAPPVTVPLKVIVLSHRLMYCISSCC